jgi:NAD-dependent deacetylase
MLQLTPEKKLAIEQAARLVQKARRVVALTGAGISTPSGIPDFRSEESGLWKRYNPFEVASLSAFRYRPENFFNWLREIVLEIDAAYPNPAHEALARLEETDNQITIITQNVDGLHQRAGSRHVLEIHGTLQTATCIRCYQKYATEGILRPFLLTGEIARCEGCGGLLKPDIILFEEQLPYKTWMKAQEACKNSDLMIVIGSSLEVMPVAGLPMLALEHNNAPLIIINKTTTYLDVRASHLFHDDVAEIIPALVAEVFRTV